MPLILAIEPDRHQAAHLKSIVRSSLNAELVLGDSVAHALTALGDRVPDLVLTAPLLSPKDERALDLKLRSMDGAAAHVQTLTIPALAVPEARKPAGVLARLRRGRQKKAAPEGCDPAVFAEQCAVYLERAKTERAALQEVEQNGAPPPVERESAAVAVSGSGEPLPSEPLVLRRLARLCVIPEAGALENAEGSSETVEAPPEATPGVHEVIEPPVADEKSVSIIAEAAEHAHTETRAPHGARAVAADTRGNDVQPIERVDFALTVNVAVPTEPLKPAEASATDVARAVLTVADSPAVDEAPPEVVEPPPIAAEVAQPTAGTTEPVANQAQAAVADTPPAITPTQSPGSAAAEAITAAAEAVEAMGPTSAESPDSRAAITSPAEIATPAPGPEPSLAALVAGLIDTGAAAVDEPQAAAAETREEPVESPGPLDETAAVSVLASAEPPEPIDAVSSGSTLDAETLDVPAADEARSTGELSLAAAVAAQATAGEMPDEPGPSAEQFDKAAAILVQVSTEPASAQETEPSDLAFVPQTAVTSPTPAVEPGPVAAEAAQPTDTTAPVADQVQAAAAETTEDAIEPARLDASLVTDADGVSPATLEQTGADQGEVPDLLAASTAPAETDAPALGPEPSLAALVAGLIDASTATLDERQAQAAETPREQPVASAEPHDDTTAVPLQPSAHLPEPIDAVSSGPEPDVADATSDATPPMLTPPPPSSQPSKSSALPTWLGPARVWPALGGAPIEDDARAVLEERITGASLGRLLEQGGFHAPDPFPKPARDAREILDQRRPVRHSRPQDVDAYEINVDELLAGGDAQVASLLSFASVRGFGSQPPTSSDSTPASVGSGDGLSKQLTPPAGTSRRSREGDLPRVSTQPASAAGITIDPDLWASPQPSPRQAWPSTPGESAAGQPAVPIEGLLATPGNDARPPVAAPAPPPQIPQPELVQENPVRARALAKRAARAAIAAAKAGAKRKRKAKQTNNVSDEWGFFDPAQCGFAALVSKLDEITVEPDDSIDSDR
jgi:hypothetical protein